MVQISVTKVYGPMYKTKTVTRGGGVKFAEIKSYVTLEHGP